ncbi:hypothetical protein [Roseomonas sp. USHLN139]|uniref:hypothetical protein n=1 Tax=Roseomonas sp. USHLN139 TaxID=3081298 RepID=UPI003B01E2B0
MEVVNLVPWAGEDFSYAPGEVIDLPAKIATARKKAGLVADVPPRQGSSSAPPEGEAG